MISEQKKIKLLFFVNPKSGGRSKVGFEQEVSLYLNSDKYQSQVLFWENVTFDISLYSANIIEADTLVAVGGDGTVNYVGQLCLAYKKSLGIIPLGSGNGLARHLGIPTESRKAILQLNDAEIKDVDLIQINDAWCFNIAGVGFDAYVAHQYARNQRRGFWGYTREIIKSLRYYKPVHLKITTSGKTDIGNFFMVGTANGSQWGYGFTINPIGNIADGLLELFIIKKINLFRLPSLLWMSYKRKLHLHKDIELLSVQKIEIQSSNDLAMHIDGEPMMFDNNVTIEVVSGLLKMRF